eukprot:14787104-Alexandrium_andersonii.AAC.1
MLLRSFRSPAQKSVGDVGARERTPSAVDWRGPGPPEPPTNERAATTPKGPARQQRSARV